MNTLMGPNTFSGLNLCPNFLHENTLTSHQTETSPITHYHTPVTTGSSVLGVSFKDGAIIGADMLGSYGSLARFKDFSRILRVNKNIILGVGGDIGDFQYLKELINSKMIGEECLEDDISLKPASLQCWLTRVLYNRRSKIDPLWNNILVAGLQDGKPYLGFVDKLGTALEDRQIATGYGAYIAIPLLRDALEKNPNMNRHEAEQLLLTCMEVLYYRDARSFNKFELAVITPDGIEIKGPLSITADWSISKYVRGYE